jgi:hypothetical protein
MNSCTLRSAHPCFSAVVNEPEVWRDVEVDLECVDDEVGVEERLEARIACTTFGTRNECWCRHAPITPDAVKGSGDDVVVSAAARSW